MYLCVCCHHCTAAGNADSDSAAAVSTTSVQEVESTSTTTTAAAQQCTHCRSLALKCRRLRQLASKNIVCVNLRKKLKQALRKVRTVYFYDLSCNITCHVRKLKKT